MKVCHVSPELAPYAKVGGLADVSAALPAAQARVGHEVAVFVPLYPRLLESNLEIPREPVLRDVQLRFPWGSLGFDLYEARPHKQGPTFRLIHCDGLYGRPDIYSGDGDEHLRAVFLVRAAIESCQRLGLSPDIFHVHDWMAAALPLILRTRYGWDQLFQDTRTVLTIHNIAHQGMFPASVWPEMGLEESLSHLPVEDAREGRISLLKLGIVYSDAITTVSPTYADEIRTPEYGMGMEGLLNHRSDRLVGILNGVDSTEWNPRSDRFIPFRYSLKSLWRKERNKEALLEALGLPYREGAPVVGMVTRLTAQKGLDLVQQVLPLFLEREDMRFVVLGTGESRFEEFFRALQVRHPEKVCYYRGFHEELAHLIEAGSDIFLMPSRFEPCGLNQMYSLAYGTLPVVRRTGGLADSVRQIDPGTGEGTGILFDNYDGTGLGWALSMALKVYGNPGLREAVRRNGMSEDFSWETRAGSYDALYRHLLAEVAAAGEVKERDA